MTAEIVQPLDWVEDLLAWKSPNISSDNLRLMNYDDKGYLVPADTNPYIFLNWWNVDIFCYFSHHFVTIPPSGYINAAHKHGCLVMGTFITEWKPGVEKCGKFLENEEVMEKVVSQLVNIAEFYNFDGWLINIENHLKPEQLPRMCEFLQLLTTMMRSRLGRTRVIWYDSVILDGNLKWQNQLNDLNKCFYDSCDGIYLNYNWTEEMLLNSADHGILSRIFVGVDVFGRGCIGGWDCKKPFSRAELLKMSLALFAPGWVTEKFPEEDPVQINLKFWRMVRQYVITRPIVELPVSTNFSAGLFNTNECKRFCLNDIALQPHYHDDNFHPLPEGGLLIKNAGTHRIFNFKLFERSVNIELVSSSPVSVVLNEEELPNMLEGENFKAATTTSLQSFDVVTKKKDTVIYSVYIY